MLRVTQQDCAKGAKQYYASADYYSEGQELICSWGGKQGRRSTDCSYSSRPVDSVKGWHIRFSRNHPGQGGESCPYLPLLATDRPTPCPSPTISARSRTHGGHTAACTCSRTSSSSPSVPYWPVPKTGTRSNSLVANGAAGCK